MELGRKFVFCLLAYAGIFGVAIFAMATKQPVPDSVIAAITTLALAYTGTNVAATYAHSSSTKQETRTVNERVVQEITARRITQDDDTEDTN
jgi:arginine exporter protein ArgO